MRKDHVMSYLQSWDDLISDNYLNSAQTESRRNFIKQLLLGSSATLFSSNVLSNVGKLNDDVWTSINAVQLHLFPVAKNEPDANSINATAFLKSVLEWPGVDSGDKKFVIDGAGWLNGLSQKLHNKVFVRLNGQQKEEVLRTVEKSKAGESWLSLILLYLIEALLTDPVYGANINGQGWKWLKHQPGFPRPTKEKRYFNL